MAELTLNAFKNRVRSVARANRFLLSFQAAPTGVSGFNFSDEMQYHVKSASLPNKEIGEIALSWFGLERKIGGDPVYGDYEISFINNSDFKIRLMMEQWVDYIASGVDNERKDDLTYKSIIKIDQIGNEDNVIATYYLHGCYPKSISEIGLATDSKDTPEEFSVTFAMDLWSNSDSAASGNSILKPAAATT